MMVVATSQVRLRELLDSKSTRDVARRIRDALEQAAQSRRLPWEPEDPLAPGTPRSERVSTIPFGVGGEPAESVAEARAALQLTSDSSEAAHPPSPPHGPPTVEEAPEILRRGPANASERELLAKLLAVAVIGDWVAEPQSLANRVRRLGWLAMRAQLDAFPWLDEGLGPDERCGLWSTLAEHTVALSSRADDTTRLEATAAAWHLSRGRSPEARRVASTAAARAEDGWIRSILRSSASATVLSGELGSTPRGPIATFIMAFTLVLFLSRLVQIVGRYVFAYRRPTRLRISPEGIEIEQRTELLGRILRERRHVVSLASLSRITRETLFQNLSLYAGLAALAIGTFIGSGFIADGVRVPGGSGTLLILGFLCCLLGIGLDLGLGFFDTRQPNQCRIIIRPKRGRSLCITRVDTHVADALLADVKCRLPRPQQSA